MPDKAARAQRITGELRAMRLRVTIGRHLEDQGMVTPAAIADATGLPPAEAIRLLNARKTRDGDIPALEAIAARLGLPIPPVDFDPLVPSRAGQ